MINIYDNANNMAAAITQTQQYLDLKQAFDMLKLDTVGYSLFKQFEDTQMTLQQKQSQGQEVTDDDIKTLQNLGQQMQNIDAVKALMQKEQAMAALMEELNMIVNKPIADLYQTK